MTEDLSSQLERYTRAIGTRQSSITPEEALEIAGPVRELPETPRRPRGDRRNLVAFAAAAVSVLLLVGGAAWIFRSAEGGLAEEVADTAAPSGSIVPQDLRRPVVEGAGLATGAAPAPDVVGAVPGDDGAGPVPLGSVTMLPDSVRLDFLFEFCWDEPCYRDAHFMDPDNPGFGSGVFTADVPFHVRHGFIAAGDEPLGEGFDVVIYVTPLDQPGEFGGWAVGETVRYTSDYVVRGVSEACGPTYRTQSGPVTCEWFVHDFPDGLPEGRHAMWAVWEAPCRAWLGYGFIGACTDPDEVMSLFSSGFDGPFEPFLPGYHDRTWLAP